MCEADNPGRIAAPSATQVHGTILAGVILGAIGFLFLMRFAVGAGGPYAATITDRIAADGGIQVAVQVSNTGTSSGIATCRITRDGTPRQDDFVLRTQRIEPGSSIVISRLVAQPVGGSVAYNPERMTAICA
jgi:hypothetical protein